MVFTLILKEQSKIVAGQYLDSQSSGSLKLNQNKYNRTSFYSCLLNNLTYE